METRDTIQRLKPCLLREDELGQHYLQAQEQLDQLQGSVEEIEETLTLKAHLLPFYQRREKQRKATLLGEVEKAREARDKALVEMEAYFPIVQEAARDWLEQEKDSAYLHSLKVNGFFGTSQRRLEKFREAVEAFLKAIGQSRAAMSSSYNSEEGTYSPHARALIDEAIRAGARVDEAVEDIVELNGDFATKTDGSIYSSITLPDFGRAQYERKVRRIAKEPIGPAQIAFEKLLEECERLCDKGIQHAYEILRQAEGDHREVTDDYVTQTWRELQAELLGAGGTVEGDPRPLPDQHTAATPS